MPLVRTTPEDPPPRSHVWVSGFSARGFQPGGVPEFTIEYVVCFQTPGSDPPTYEVAEARSATYNGAEAGAIFVEHLSTYESMKDTLYQILIDKGLEEGTVE